MRSLAQIALIAVLVFLVVSCGEQPSVAKFDTLDARPAQLNEPKKPHLMHPFYPVLRGEEIPPGGLKPKAKQAVPRYTPGPQIREWY